VGNRTAEGRELFLRYFRSAIDCPGPETAAIQQLADDLSLHIVIGVVERDGATLFCTSLAVMPGQPMVKHRKLMPTASERLLWGQGDGSTLAVVPTSIGRIGMAICWENYMPLLRQHLYNGNVELWCAPTVDSREIWGSSMRHIAYEGRCFVLSACQWLTREDWPDDLRDKGGVITGGSLVASPSGEILAGSLKGEGLLFADIDPDDIPRGKFDLDVAGHYSRPDVFQLTVRS
jgi:nitrilase